MIEKVKEYTIILISELVQILKFFGVQGFEDAFCFHFGLGFLVGLFFNNILGYMSFFFISKLKKLSIVRLAMSFDNLTGVFFPTHTTETTSTVM